MRISYDPAKRAETLVKHGLDFDDALKVFAGLERTRIDDRWDYGEDRYQTLGLLDNRLIMLVWTPTQDGRRIISMRYCHAKEEKRWREDLA